MPINDAHTPARGYDVRTGDEPIDERELLSDGDDRPTLPPPPEWRERIEQSERGCAQSDEEGRACWYVAFGPCEPEQVRDLLSRTSNEMGGDRCYLFNRAKGTWTQGGDFEEVDHRGSQKHAASPPPLPRAPAAPVRPPPLPRTKPPVPVREKTVPLVKPVEPEEEVTEQKNEVQGNGSGPGRESFPVPRGGEFLDPASGVLRIEERDSDRVTFKASVTLSSECNFWTGIASDISAGGLFIATYNAVPTGTRVGLDFSMPDDGPRIRAVGEVVWQRVFREDNELIPGMGVRFVHLSAQDKERIGAFVEDRGTLLFEE